MTPAARVAAAIEILDEIGPVGKAEQTGRALMLGLLRRQGDEIADIFSGEGYGPAALEAHELAMLETAPDLSLPEQADLPDWLWPLWCDSLGDDAMAAARALQTRAPISLRVNTRPPIKDVNTALQVIENERRIKMSAAYGDGLVELQDVASQIAFMTLRSSRTTSPRKEWPIFLPVRSVLA